MNTNSPCDEDIIRHAPALQADGLDQKPPQTKHNGCLCMSVALARRARLVESSQSTLYSNTTSAQAAKSPITPAMQKQEAGTAAVVAT